MEDENPHYGYSYDPDDHWFPDDEQSAGGQAHSCMCVGISHSLFYIRCKDAQAGDGMREKKVTTDEKSISMDVRCDQVIGNGILEMFV